MATFVIHEDVKEYGENNGKVDKKPNNLKKRALALRSTQNDEVKSKRVKFNEPETKSRIPIKVRSACPQTVPSSSSSPSITTEGLNLQCLSLVDEKKAEKEKKRLILSCQEKLFHNKDYNEHVWKYLFELETKTEWPKVNYMRKQADLTFSMRSLLVDWLASVAHEYEMNEQTLHLAVHYIDRFLSHMSVVRGKFQLLGAAAMMIAGKMEEIYPPNAKEWAYLTQATYSANQVIRMEQLIVKTLRFELQSPTIYTFIQQFCIDHQLNNQTKFLALYLSELVLLEGDDYLSYLPSKLASAAIALARMTISRDEPWPKKMKDSTGYTLKELSPIVKKQHQTFRDSPTKSEQTIQTKYQSAKYYKVALIKPHILKLDE